MARGGWESGSWQGRQFLFFTLRRVRIRGLPSGTHICPHLLLCFTHHAGQGTADFSRFNELLSMAGALPLQPRGSLCVWVAVSSGLRGCMEPILKACSGRARRVAAAEAAVDVLRHCIRALEGTAGRVPGDGSGGGSSFTEAADVTTYSDAGSEWCRCFDTLVKTTRR